MIIKTLLKSSRQIKNYKKGIKIKVVNPYLNPTIFVRIQSLLRATCKHLKALIKGFLYFLLIFKCYQISYKGCHTTIITTVKNNDNFSTNTDLFLHLIYN